MRKARDSIAISDITGLISLFYFWNIGFRIAIEAIKYTKIVDFGTLFCDIKNYLIIVITLNLPEVKNNTYLIYVLCN